MKFQFIESLLLPSCLFRLVLAGFSQQHDRGAAHRHAKPVCRTWRDAKPRASLFFLQETHHAR